MTGLRSPRHGRQTGAALAETALALLPFLLIVFAMMEFSRGLYVFMALQEATRAAARAASVTRFDDAAALAALRRQALFGGASGILPLSGGIDQSYLRITYLSLSAANAMNPVDTGTVTPESNVATCAATPNAAGCIRFVRVQVCDPAGAPGACDPAPFPPVFPVPFLQTIIGNIKLPLSTTLTPAESLGARPPCGPC